MEESPRAAQTRARLLNGCAIAVGARGVRSTTVEHVVRAAGMSRRTFYLYFRDKEAVLLGLYEQVVSDLVDRMHSAVREALGPVPGLLAAIKAYLDIQQEGGRLIAELQAEAANPASALWPVRVRTVDALVQLTDSEVRSVTGIALHPDVYAMLFHGLEALVIQHRDGGPLIDSARDQVESTVRAVILTTLAGASGLPRREPDHVEGAEADGDDDAVADNADDRGTVSTS
jgi:AcrR family transcriptional regulator